MIFAKGKSVVLLGFFVSLAVDPISTRGATIRDDVPDGNYTDLGANSAYAAVGTFVGGLYTGCGVLIAPDWVLTAAHLLELTSSSSGTFTIGGTAYTSDAVYTDPAWNNNALDGNDFGLVHLNTSISSVDPARLFTGSSPLGQVGTWVGYGYTGTGLTGWHTLDNQKRAFENVLDGTFQNPLLLGSDFDSPETSAYNLWGDATPLPLEGCVAPGDSGGGLFLTVGSQTYLAGVISFESRKGGGLANSSYGDLSGAGLITTATPWITSTVPEPSTCSLLAGAGLVLFFGRRFWNS
jgi:hypothetical protein